MCSRLAHPLAMQRDGPDQDAGALPLEPALPPSESAWSREMHEWLWRLAERYSQPMTLDLGFLAYLRALERFGFFMFGPVVIDVGIVEDAYARTRLATNSSLPVSEDYVRFSELLMREVRQSGRSAVDELHYLLAFMRVNEGLPSRIFGELGVTPEDVEDYVRELTTGKTGLIAPGGERLYSTEEVADYFGVHVQTVRGWIRSRRLPAAKLAGQKSIRVRERDLRRMLQPIEPGDVD